MELSPVDSKTVRYVPQEGVDPMAVPSDETVKNATQAVAPLLRGNIDVTAAAPGENRSREIEVPALDEALNGASEDLEKLIALLSLESDEEQIDASMNRLKALLEKMDVEQQKVLKNLAYALEETKKVEEAQKKAEALGWIMLGLSVLATVITSVVTFGAGTAGAVAIIGCVASIAATTLTAANQIATACGGRDACVEKRTEEIMERDGCSKKEAKEKAEKEWDMGWGIATGILSLVSMACGIGEIAMAIKSATKAAAKVAEEAAKAAAKAGEKGAEAAAKAATGLASKSVQLALKITGTAIQAASAGVSVGQAVLAFEIADYIKKQSEAAAELAEVQAFLEQIQQAIDEEQDTLKQLLMNLQSSLDLLARLLSAQTETLEAIMANFNTNAAV